LVESEGHVRFVPKAETVLVGIHELGKTGAVILCRFQQRPHTNGMRDIFACNKCNSIYEITRLQQQPALPPRCQVCFASFPPSELGDWLAYERAEPEWSVGEWLGGRASQFSLPSPREAFVRLVQREVRPVQREVGLAQRKIDIVAPAQPSNRLASLSTPGAFDER
jgi:hypothetical protein